MGDSVVEIIRHIVVEQGFNLLPSRRMVERTFNLMTRWGRPIRPFGSIHEAQEAIICVAIVSLMPRLNGP